MSMQYDPPNWYWASPLGNFSSARLALVPDDDADFVAWTRAGGVPTPMPKDASGAQTLAALREQVLAPLGLPTTLADLQATLKARADARAEALRQTLITPGSGQAMEYQEAYAEAVQVDAALKVNPSAALDPAAYPMLAASIGCDLDPTTGKPTVDLAGEARSVLAAYDLYQTAGAAIRGARLRGKAAIDAAADAAAAQAAFAAIVWPALG